MKRILLALLMCASCGKFDEGPMSAQAPAPTTTTTEESVLEEAQKKEDEHGYIGNTAGRAAAVDAPNAAPDLKPTDPAPPPMVMPAAAPSSVARKSENGPHGGAVADGVLDVTGAFAPPTEPAIDSLAFEIEAREPIVAGLDSKSVAALRIAGEDAEAGGINSRLTGVGQGAASGEGTRRDSPDDLNFFAKDADGDDDTREPEVAANFDRRSKDTSKVPQKELADIEQSARDATGRDGKGKFKSGSLGGGKSRPQRLARGAHTVVFADDAATFAPPVKTLPRMFYFENTYLGGSAAYAERLRRLERSLQNETRPYEIVQADVQPFDPPRADGLGLTASVDTPYFDQARRVFLQVGLRGSSRYGWRRPPLDIVLVVDQPAFLRGAPFVTSFVVEVLRQLGATDRLGIVLAGQDAPVFLELTRLDSAQQHLANRIDRLAAPAGGGSIELAEAMHKAGFMLAKASDDEATVPGTKTILVLSGEADPNRISQATSAAHALTVQGCVTSVFALNAEQGEWWQVPNAGYGNLHRITETAFAPALDEEMQSIARVVARLVRVNVRLGKDVKAVRVLGTRVLDKREVDEVKARELATDLSLSKSLGITSDRGEDDDGIQTVIPYFYGDDSHVILIELWVEGPGMVADVTVRYKDMVNLDNAESRVSVRIGQRPQPATPAQDLIARNVRGFQLAENLQKASDAVYRNDFRAAVDNLGSASTMAADTNQMDVQAIEDLKAMVERNDWQSNPARRATVQETLLISGQRRVGDTNTDKK